MALEALFAMNPPLEFDPAAEDNNAIQSASENAHSVLCYNDQRRRSIGSSLLIRNLNQMFEPKRIL